MIEATPSPKPGNFSEQRLREMERQLEEKESQLRERDRTVKELTQRLSQTVERLDRVQRGGSDRVAGGMSAFPKEVVEQQSELVEDLQRTVQLWEKMQIACDLGKLETQLSDLRKLFEEHFREEEPQPEPGEAEEETAAAEDSDPQAMSEGSRPEDAQDSLESLAEELDPPAEAEDYLQSLDEACPLRPPEILNLTEAGEQDLRRCVQQQDAYIDYLSTRLKRVAEKQTAVDWDELAKKPQKLIIQLEHMATKLQQSRHFAEFELALQRARLKRKERELKIVSDELTLRMKSANGQHDPATGKDTPNGGRWMRMLGMGKKESE